MSRRTASKSGLMLKGRFPLPFILTMPFIFGALPKISQPSPALLPKESFGRR
jgi:hypothetical protein